MSDFINLKNFETTLGDFEDIVRTNLKVTNPTLLKSGALGVLTSYLANLKYDTAQYYTKVFKEMNIGLAEDFKSLLFHSTIYDTDIELAQPSTFGVSFIIPEISLSDVKYIKYIIPKNKAFNSYDGLPFIIEDEIIIEISKERVRAYMYNPDVGQRELGVVKTENPNIPGNFIYLINYNGVKQYERTFYKFIVPKYNAGENYVFSIAIQNFIMFKGLNAWYNKNPAENPIRLYDLNGTSTKDIAERFNIEEFNVKYYNYGSSRYDMDIFLDIQPTSLQLTTGDGINGAILAPDSEIIIESQITFGEKGNLSNMEFMIEDVIVEEIMQDGKKQSYAGTLNGLSVVGGTGGQNIQTVEDIRKNIFDKITLRNSIITENDYEKAFSYNSIEPFVDAKFIDAKSFIFLFNVLRYQDRIIKTTSLNIREYEIANNPFYPTQNYNGVDLISPFYFKRVNTNETEGYIVNPKVILNLVAPVGGDEASNISNLVDMSITYDFGLRKTYIQIDAGSKTNYTYHFKSSIFDCVLSHGDDFKYEVNTRYTDTYCIIHDPMRDIQVDVYDELGQPVATYIAPGEYHQLIKKQTFFKYYKNIPEVQGQSVYTTDDTLSYLDNVLADILAQVEALVSSGEDAGEVPYLLRIPYVEKQFFEETEWLTFYRLMDGFFMVDKLIDQVSYNTKVAQTFYNTIDIPEKYHDFLFEQNTMGTLFSPNLPIELTLFINEQDLLLSRYRSIFEFEVAVKIELINYLKRKEGFRVTLFETEIETLLFDKFSPIVKNVELKTPKLFQVNSPDMIFNGLKENLEFDDLLDFVPPYFSYDYDNIHIEILT